jgi:hypothetical protein
VWGLVCFGLKLQLMIAYFLDAIVSFGSSDTQLGVGWVCRCVLRCVFNLQLLEEGMCKGE